MLGPLHLLAAVSPQTHRDASKLAGSTTLLPSSYTLCVCLSVCLMPIRTCTCHNRTLQTKHTNTHNATTWQLNITKAIKGNSIQLSLFFAPNLLLFKTSQECLFGLHQWERDSTYLPFVPHLSATLGSALRDSRRSTHEAIWSSLAEAVILAISTVH